MGETNFEIEVQQHRRVRDNFNQWPVQGLQTMKGVKIPEVYAHNAKTIVMERLQGKTGAEILMKWRAGAIVPLFGREQRDDLFKMYATQVFVHGFVQVDVHPGNFMLLDDDNIGLIDFGQTADFPSEAHK